MILTVSDEQGASQEVQGQLYWPLDDPVMYGAPMVNQTLTTIQRLTTGMPQYILMTFGHSTAPTFAGNPQDQLASAQALAAANGGVLPVRIEPVARVVVTIDHMRDIAKIAAETVEKWDAFVAQTKDAT